MTGDETQRTVVSGQPRPQLVSQYSSSLPATPKQHARDMSRARTPSPHRLHDRHSPRSVISESGGSIPFLKPTIPTCRFQSTQTSRRRMKYTIGADVLEPDEESAKATLDAATEKQLTLQMNALHKDLLPSAESQDNREKVVEKLRGILQEEMPNRKVDVSVFGSSGNLLNTSKSDVDICISVRGLETVCSLAELLSRRGMKNVTCVHAKAVPIVKIWDPQYQMACDLNVNNHVALRNTRLVKAYMELDDRVRPLALIIKFWTKRRIINEASGGTLSSYTWTLLVIHFLQTLDVPILPVLATTDADGKQREEFGHDLEKHRDFGKANKESLGRLVFKFFHRYGHEIDYETAVMSVRTGKILSKKDKKWHLATNNRLCVEEPFNTDRNLGNTADDTAFRGLHLEIRQAFTRLREGKDLVSSVCEQYEFPPDDPKPIFERPQPGPRPILSRSTSQSGRGGRRNGRGNRGGFDFRNGNAGRRSSSAAAYGHASMPAMQSPGLIMPSADYFYAPTHMLSPAELEVLSRQIGEKQHLLRLQQLQLTQQQMSTQIQHAHAMSVNQHHHQHRSASAGTPNPQFQRMQTNGIPSPALSAVDMAPVSAPLNAPHPFGNSTESSVPMSHSSSAQDDDTNPNSPVIAPSTPHRRGLQRGHPQVTSPGAAVRSHSQPARPVGPNSVPMTGLPRTQYPQAIMAPFAMGSRPVYYGPYIHPMNNGPYYVAVPSAEALPREYLGYGIGGPAPAYYGGLPADVAGQVPVQGYEDITRQGRQMSPSRRHSSMGTASSLDLPRSPSPQFARPSHENFDLNSAAIVEPDVANGSTVPPALRVFAEDSTPMIANGSYYSPVTRTNQPKEPDIRRTSEPLRKMSNGSSEAGKDGGIRRTQSNQSFAARVGASIAASEKARRDALKLNFIASDDSEGHLTMSPSKDKRKPSQEMPPPPRPSETRSATTKDKSPDTANASRRPSGGGRAQIPPLDLGRAHANGNEKLRDSQPHLLSPVEERRTPSPASNRKAWQRNSLPLTGLHGMSSLGDVVTKGERQAGHGRAGQQSRPLQATEHSSISMNGIGRGSRRSASPTKGQPGGRTRPLSQAVTPTEAAQVAQQSSNSWQQAGKGKKSKRKGADHSTDGGDKKTGGQPMPDNVAERKGG